jgi:hypothetical protein
MEGARKRVQKKSQVRFTGKIVAFETVKSRELRLCQMGKAERETSKFLPMTGWASNRT